MHTCTHAHAHAHAHGHGHAHGDACVAQAESLGSLFRNSLFPAEGGGFLRLHSTYRHDLHDLEVEQRRLAVVAGSAVAYGCSLYYLWLQARPQDLLVRRGARADDRGGFRARLP